MTEVPEEQHLADKFYALPDAERQALVAQLDEQLRTSNIRLAAERDYLRQVVVRLRPVVPLVNGDRVVKGRLTCLVCHAQGKKREFTHLQGCDWFRSQEWMRQQREAADAEFMRKMQGA